MGGSSRRYARSAWNADAGWCHCCQEQGSSSSCARSGRTTDRCRCCRQGRIRTKGKGEGGRTIKDDRREKGQGRGRTEGEGGGLGTSRAKGKGGSERASKDCRREKRQGRSSAKGKGEGGRTSKDR